MLRRKYKRNRIRYLTRKNTPYQSYKQRLAKWKYEKTRKNVDKTRLKDSEATSYNQEFRK